MSDTQDLKPPGCFFGIEWLEMSYEGSGDLLPVYANLKPEVALAGAF